MLLKNARVIDPANNIDDILDVHIQNNTICQVGKNIDTIDLEVIDLQGYWLTPGLIDMHTHLREPGYKSKETIQTGTTAAMMGGYTSVCCMANTKPVIDDPIILEHVMNKAEIYAKTNVFPVAAVTKGLEGKLLTNMAQLSQNGAIAFSDDGKPLTNTNIYRNALRYSSMLDMPIISHPEDPFLAEDGVMNEGYYSTKLGLKGIPAAAESIAVARELELLRYIGGRIHFAHISTARSVELIRDAKKEGLSVTCETAPHYFSLTDESLKEFNPNFKMNPPLRGQKDVEAIKEGLRDGTIDAIATDHAPHTYEEKFQDMDNAPFGIVGLETALSVTLSTLVHTQIISPIKAISLLSTKPSQILKLNRGSLTVGATADISIIDPDLSWTVDANKLHSKGKNTPFDGMSFKGKAVATILNGKFQFNSIKSKQEKDILV